MAAHLDSTAKGVFAILATPFTDLGELDLASTDGLVDFYLGHGVAGLTILGVMGEAPKLSHEESVAFLDRVLKRTGSKVPVVVGVSNPGLRSLAHLAQTAMDRGAAGVMVAPVPSLRTEEQIYGYFADVCQALGHDVPVALQDYPQGNGVFMSSATIERVLSAFRQVVMVKHEDWPGLPKLGRLAGNTTRRKISILVGNGGLHLPEELGRGADGAMTGFSYPEVLVETCRLFAAGAQDAAHDIFDLYLPLIRHEYQFGIGLAIRKEILRRRGAIASACARLPGPKLDQADHAEIGRLIARLERKLATRT